LSVADGAGDEVALIAGACAAVIRERSLLRICTCATETM